MSTPWKVAASAAFVAATAFVQQAGACEITRTPWGPRLTGCKLSALYQGRYDLSVDTTPVSPVLRLPNLRPTDVDVGFVNRVGEVTVELQNNGTGNVGQFEVAGMAGVTDPLNNGLGVGSVLTFPPLVVPGLASGAGTVKYIGSVEVPNRTQDWDVCTMVVVDPPTSTRASGSVFETNEGDNQWSGCCRIYGPNPDLTGPPAC